MFEISSGVIVIVIVIWLKVLSVERTLERINQSIIPIYII